MMELKDILATRLRSLMDHRPDLDTQTKIHKKTGLSQSTVQRILAREVHTSLDIVELLAHAFGVNPQDLIKPLKVDEYQSITPNYEETTLLIAWRKLSEEDKHRAMAYISVSVETRIRQDPKARQINLNLEQPVPAKLSAAVRRASKRSPGNDNQEIQVNDQSEGSQTAKRKGRAA